jgi:hypothetical protein
MTMTRTNVTQRIIEYYTLSYFKRFLLYIIYLYIYIVLHVFMYMTTMTMMRMRMLYVVPAIVLFYL